MRRTWSTPEKCNVRRHFSWYLENHKIPSIQEVQDIACANGRINYRSSVNIQTWIRAEISRRQDSKYFLFCFNAILSRKKTYWNFPCPLFISVFFIHDNSCG